MLFFSKGVPQGSVLGPLLFNIFLKDLFCFINRANLSNYVDDDQIYFSDRDPEVVKSVINGDLVVASRWFDDNKLVLNPEKCKCIIPPKNYPCDLSFSISDAHSGQTWCACAVLPKISLDKVLNFRFQAQS